MVLKLLDLPGELLGHVAQRLPSIYDLYSLLRTCRTLYEVLGPDHGNGLLLPPILPQEDGRHLLDPHPYLILAGTVRQVADWAVASDERQDGLYELLIRGPDGLFELVQRVARVGVKDMRRLHEQKYSLLQPLTDLVDREAGPKHRRMANFHNRHRMGVDEWNPSGYEDDESEDDDVSSFTICEQPERAILNIWIYSELFHHYVDAVLRYASSSTPTLDLRIRRRFLATCLPDYNNHRHPNWKRLGGAVHDSLSPKSHRGEWQHLDALQVLTAPAAERLATTVRRFFEQQPSLDPSRLDLCCLLARQLDDLALSWLLLEPEDFIQSSAARGRVIAIRDAVAAIPTVEFDRWHNGSLDEEGWYGWHGLGTDLHEGIETNQMSEEEVMEEQRQLDEELEERRKRRRTGKATK